MPPKSPTKASTADNADNADNSDKVIPSSRELASLNVPQVIPSSRELASLNVPQVLPLDSVAALGLRTHFLRPCGVLSGLACLVVRGLFGHGETITLFVNGTSRSRVVAFLFPLMNAFK